MDDWDLETYSVRQYRVLTKTEDADSGEEYFRETPFGLSRHVRPPRMVKRKRGVEKLETLEMSMVGLSDEGEEEPREHDPMEMDTPEPVVATTPAPAVASTVSGAMPTGGFQREPSTSISREHVGLPGSPLSRPEHFA